MRCPRCQSLASKVVDSRLTPREDAIRRRRECETCQHRYTSYERIERVTVYVVKKDGLREPFDPDKLLDGVLKALHRRPVPVERVEELVRDIEARLAERGLREVASTRLGELVMDFLRQTDHVAYVRFASVYRSFQDLGAFVAAVEGLASEEASDRASAEGWNEDSGDPQ